eukprot:1627606-Rhodomonas_salina.1
MSGIDLACTKYLLHCALLVQPQRILLRIRYAMSGTATAYRAKASLCAIRYSDGPGAGGAREGREGEGGREEERAGKTHRS